MRLVPEHAIDSIKVVKQPDAKDKKALVAPLPAIDVAACKKRESEAYEAMEAAMAMLNPERFRGGPGLLRRSLKNAGLLLEWRFPLMCWIRLVSRRALHGGRLRVARREQKLS